MSNDNSKTVYILEDTCNVSDLLPGRTYKGTVQGFAAFGTFVYLNASVKGLVHKTKAITTHKENAPILVLVSNIRNNGNIDLEEVALSDYSLQTVHCKRKTVLLADLKTKVGRRVVVECEIAQIKQTSGPTIFTLVDATGTENAAGFIEAGKRAFPDANQGDIARITGEVMQRGGQVQIEIDSLKVLSQEEADEVKQRLDEALNERAEPENIPFLIESEVLERLRPEIRKIAQLIRRAVFTAQPILLRHHADADGVCSAVAIEQAVIGLINASGGDYDSDHFLFKRAPSKAPFYEVEDVVRDLDYATRDNARFGQKLPMILLTDNGSTEEDIPSMRFARTYGMPIIVFDHHHPDEIVDQYLEAHVNPYHVGGDYGITAGMLGTEIARMIHPPVQEKIRHIPAIAGVGDRSEAAERYKYLELVKNEFDEETCKKIALAIDYLQFYLRFNDGRELIRDLLFLNDNAARSHQLMDLLVQEANQMIGEQMRTCFPHLERSKLSNGAHLIKIDVEIHAHKFTFPPPGKTSGEIHDRVCKENEQNAVVTLGYGPDFIVLRSRGVLMNIPQMVRELRDELPGAGVNGGGHLVVGSIKFVEGMRTEVLNRLVEKIEAFQLESN